MVASHLNEKLHDNDTEEQRQGCRHRTLKILESTKFELLITLLILIELMLVIVEVTIANTVTCHHGISSSERHLSEVPAADASMCPHWARSCDASGVIRYISLALLFFFLVELMLKFVLAPKNFILHIGHVVDVVVVVVSIVFELFLDESEVEALIILRAWRCVRIAHGFYEEFSTLREHDHLLRESEDALHACLTFIEKKELHDEFRSFCVHIESSPSKELEVRTADVDISGIAEME
eukprot:GEMP01055261.1.p1 GENE.GEMP01055261.1~~GEMP01055261.1.p1  ORF type:complete len:238 (+),score=44.52 GEMP01055261.1:292-1005(+)